GTILGITGISLVDIKQAVSQPAPPLSSVSITAVQSTQNPSWESIPQGNLSTSEDHGGRFLCVKTEERGYGQNQIVLFSGNRMLERSSTPILGWGRIVVGWKREWCYSSNTTFSSGRVTFQANSINSTNRLSTSLSIR
ncbi:MAG: DUF4879 domain-containing protein, partial [Dolichospermum sp.]